MFVLWKYNLSILEALQLWFTLKTLFDSILLTRTHSFCMDIQIHRTLNTSQWKEIVHQCVCVWLFLRVLLQRATVCDNGDCKGCVGCVCWNMCKYFSSFVCLCLECILTNLVSFFFLTLYLSDPLTYKQAFIFKAVLSCLVSVCVCGWLESYVM